jgi:hypothetical protein
LAKLKASSIDEDTGIKIPKWKFVVFAKKDDDIRKSSNGEELFEEEKT